MKGVVCCFLFFKLSRSSVVFHQLQTKSVGLMLLGILSLKKSGKSLILLIKEHLLPIAFIIHSMHTEAFLTSVAVCMFTLAKLNMHSFPKFPHLLPVHKYQVLKQVHRYYFHFQGLSLCQEFPAIQQCI